MACDHRRDLFCPEDVSGAASSERASAPSDPSKPHVADTMPTSLGRPIFLIPRQHNLPSSSIAACARSRTTCTAFAGWSTSSSKPKVVPSAVRLLRDMAMHVAGSVASVCARAPVTRAYLSLARVMTPRHHGPLCIVESFTTTLHRPYLASSRPIHVRMFSYHQATIP